MRRVSLTIFGGTLAVALSLSTGGAGAAPGPASASSRTVAVASSKASAVKAVPRVLSCLSVPEVRPPSYLMSCADANAAWRNVRWVNWGLKTALGTGDLYQNDCQPNCVSGHFHSYAAKVVLSEVTQTKKYGPLYSRATFSYTVKGKHESETFGLAT